MILIVFPLIVYTLSLAASVVLAIFLRRYVWKLCIHKAAAFTIGATVFLVVSKLLSIAVNLILFATARMLGPEASNLLGILAFSYGSEVLYFIAIVKTILLFVVGLTYLSAKAKYTSIVPEPETVMMSPVALRLATGISIIISFGIVFGPWGPLYAIVTVPARVHIPRILATSLHQPRLCLLMPLVYFDASQNYRTPGIRCIRDSQTEEDYYNHCDLIPRSVREAEDEIYNSLQVNPNMSPYQECVTRHTLSLTNDSLVSLSEDQKAATCSGIQNLARRAACLLPYAGTSAWTTMCNIAIASHKEKDNTYNAKDAVIIGKCLDEKTVTESDADGVPLWFNHHVITGYEEYGIPVKTPEILYWLSSIGVNPNSTTPTGQNFLSYLLDSAFSSEEGQAVEHSYATDFVKLGIDVHSKDSSGLSAMDYAFSGGYSRLVYGLLPLFQEYKPSSETITSFLEACHDYGERGTVQDECHGLFYGEHYEQARKEFLKLGLLE